MHREEVLWGSAGLQYEVRPEPGERFALVGDVEIVVKGFGHMMRKGTLVVTDRRIAFKGRYSMRSLAHVAAHAAGAGRVDMSIPYEMVRTVRKASLLSGFHVDILFTDEDSGKKRRLRVKIHRWGSASEAIHGADVAIQAMHAGELALREIDFLPIVGDFASLTARMFEWQAGRESSDVWIEVIRDAMERAGSEPMGGSALPEVRGGLCKGCGSELEDGWIACPVCGKDAARCPGCGSDMEDGWVACPFCGYGMRQ